MLVLKNLGSTIVCFFWQYHFVKSWTLNFFLLKTGCEDLNP